MRLGARSQPICQSEESGCLGLQSEMGGNFHLKLNIGERPIANKYCEGKMKRTLKRELKVLEIVKRESFGSSIRLTGESAGRSPGHVRARACCGPLPLGGGCGGVSPRAAGRGSAGALFRLRVGQHLLAAREKPRREGGAGELLAGSLSACYSPLYGAPWRWQRTARSRNSFAPLRWRGVTVAVGGPGCRGVRSAYAPAVLFCLCTSGGHYHERTGC